MFAFLQLFFANSPENWDKNRRSLVIFCFSTAVLVVRVPHAIASSSPNLCRITQVSGYSLIVNILSFFLKEL
jgi:hypothetical protein